jgi:hypothetical protein
MTRSPFFATTLTACSSSTVSEYVEGVFVPLIWNSASGNDEYCG